MGSPLLPTTECKRCGRPIIWRKSTKTGADIPLDARRGQVYLARSGVAICVPLDDAYVTHFATCPHASEFGKGRPSTSEAAGDRNKLANAVLALVKSDPYVDAELDCTRVCLIENAIEVARCS